MNYKDGEILAASIIESAPGFNTQNVFRGSKWRALNSGKSDHYAVLRKGQHTETFSTMRQKEQKYRTVVKVVQQVKDDLNDRYDDLLEHVKNLIEYLDTFRHLGDSTHELRDANITGADEVKEVWIKDTLAWIECDVYLDWTGENYVTFAE